MWILMDNSLRVVHKNHSRLDSAKIALTTLPQALPLTFSFVKEQNKKSLRELVARRSNQTLISIKSVTAFLSPALLVMAVD